MTVITFLVTLLSLPSARVQRESSQLCLCDESFDSSNDNINNNVETRLSRRSSFHKPPSSKWHSNRFKRSMRTSFDNKDATCEDFGFAASASGTDWDLEVTDDVGTEAKERKA